MVKTWRKVLMVLCCFVAIGALGGSLLGFIASDGSLIKGDGIITTLQEVPFFGDYIDSLILPASLLFIFVFIPQTLAFALLLKRHSKQYTVALIGGLVLIGFTLVEIVVIPNPLSWLYMVIGLVEIVSVIIISRKRSSSAKNMR